MTYSITRRLEFDAGHRVYGHESKCANIHGHRYVVLITAEPKDGLDKLGRVIDFSVIKKKVGGWIDDALDHGMLLGQDDPLVGLWHQLMGGRAQKHTVMKNNPTAENIAQMIFEYAQILLSKDDVKITEVTVQETPNCSATYRP